MISFPRIQIQQQYAKLGIDANLGTQDIRQPRAGLEMKTTRPKLDMESPRGNLTIDQSKAWDALGLGSILVTMDRVRAQAKNMALEGIARRVEDGNRMAAIHTDTNAIADIAKQSFSRSQFNMNYVGPASYDNVDISYTASKPNIQVEDGRVDIEARVNKPQIDYIRGKLDIYMQQYGKVDITVSQLDTMM